MTKKLNLTPLIKHFSTKNPAIAHKLASHTDAKMQKNVKLQRLHALANTLIEIGDKLDKENPSLASEADSLLQQVVRQAQGLDQKKVEQFQKGLVQPQNALTDAAKGVGNWFSKQIQDRKEKLHSGSGQKLMGEQDPMLVIIEDQDLDPNPSTSGCSTCSDTMGGCKCSGPMLMGEGEDLVQSLEVGDLTDPEIEDVKEPEPEYDMVTLDDIKDELNNIRFRISDKRRREALEEAIEHIEKAMEYHGASTRRRQKAHEIFDGANLLLRLKDFD